MTTSWIIQAVRTTDMLPFRLALLRPHQPVETCVFPGDSDAITVHLGAFLLNEIKGIVSLYREDLAGHEAGNGYRFCALAIAEALR
ncbi:MAG: hypothetical protein ACO3R5_13685 [Pseudohongiellaceae bacterium]